LLLYRERVEVRFHGFSWVESRTAALLALMASKLAWRRGSCNFARHGSHSRLPT
jgi:hypothetical protein